MISYIEIENFKSIKNLKIDLNPINILIGANGVGKSNFIGFLKLVNTLYEQSLQNYFMKNEIDSVFYNGRKNSDYIYGKLFFNHNVNSFFFKIEPTSTDNLVYINTEGYGYNANRDDDYFNYFSSSNIRESEVKVKNGYRNKYIRESLENLQVFHFHDTSENSPLRKDSDVDDNNYLKHDGRNIASYLYFLKEIHPINYKRIVTVIRTIAPFFKDFILEPNNFNKNRISLRWKNVNDDESNFSAHQFSDGTLRFIALSTLLLQPSPPKVIVIDEPELGLHPFAINTLSGLLKSCSVKSQIIISTQSASLISNFEPNDILVVENDSKEKQTNIFRLKNEDLESWLESYTLGDIWEQNKMNFGQPQ